jgi:hypothetical protein
MNERNLLFTILSVWILGLRPSAGQGGCLKAAKSSSETSAVITTAVMADLPVLAKVSVADPDPGSGAFLTPGSGIPIRDEQTLIIFQRT